MTVLDADDLESPYARRHEYHDVSQVERRNEGLIRRPKPPTLSFTSDGSCDEDATAQMHLDNQISRMHDEMLGLTEECRIKTETIENLHKSLGNMRHKFMYEIRLVQKAILNLQQQRGRKSTEETEILQQYTKLLNERETLLARTQEYEQTIQELKMSFSSLVAERKRTGTRSQKNKSPSRRDAFRTSEAQPTEQRSRIPAPRSTMTTEHISIKTEGARVPGIDACTLTTTPALSTCTSEQAVHLSPNPWSTRDVARMSRPIDHLIGVTQTDDPDERPSSAASSVQFIKSTGEPFELGPM